MHWFQFCQYGQRWARLPIFHHVLRYVLSSDLLLFISSAFSLSISLISSCLPLSSHLLSSCHVFLFLLHLPLLFLYCMGIIDFIAYLVFVRVSNSEQCWNLFLLGFQTTPKSKYFQLHYFAILPSSPTSFIFLRLIDSTICTVLEQQILGFRTFLLWLDQEWKRRVQRGRTKHVAMEFEMW